MNSRKISDPLILKLVVIKELNRLGGVSINEFPSLISKITQHLNSMGYSISPGDVIHLLDVISISNDKVTLSNEGLHYLRTIEILANNITKTS
ncbi:hypothetical protein Vdis_1742 [Vulcanisaeta distributa DSM 14429]|uniref:Uncharacterized protein n=1 Tax=Vulcanisaeta distributa (strain DSM 14429 / JCM 11212 / NBRC 100878 / IC-017) TaxID=572478 RepID=E1QUJ7_VULDI|nr:hypothetical protein Vdis_1742 [Vulcanisaeta distributa DSM 14429]